MACLRCGDLGEINGCPKCGKVTGEVKSTSAFVVPEVAVADEIPPQYKGVEWNSDIILTEHPDHREDTSVKIYVQQLDKLYGMFEQGRMPKTSAILIAPPRYGKVTFAYCCLQHAIQAGLSVLPLLDNTQIKRINALSAEKPSSLYLWKKCTPEAIDSVDVLFMTIDKDNYTGALKTIESILDKRARNGRATFIISRYSLSEMDYYNRGRNYTSIIDRTRKNNNLKYPSIITAFAGGLR